MSGFEYKKKIAGVCSDGFCGNSENPINEEWAFFVKNSFGDEKTDFLNEEFEKSVVNWCALHNEK